MGLDEDNVTYETKPTQPIQSHSRQPSETSCYATKDEVEGNKKDEEEEACLQLGPICGIKEHLEKDKDDESLRRWKEQLLGSVDVNVVEGEEKLYVFLFPTDSKPQNRVSRFSTYGTAGSILGQGTGVLGSRGHRILYQNS